MVREREQNSIKVVAYGVIPYNNGFIYVVTAKDGMIGLPGGKIESFEGINDAVVREISEEIGVEVVVRNIVGIDQFRSKGGSPIVSVSYSCEIVEGVPHIIRPNEIKAILSPALAEVRTFYREGKLRSGEVSLRPLERYLRGEIYPLNLIQTLISGN